MGFLGQKKKDKTQIPPKRGQIKVRIMCNLVEMIIAAALKARKLGKRMNGSAEG
ncbi:hypothetical protein Dimus_034602, partial [Dionaea muscipula]